MHAVYFNNYLGSYYYDNYCFKGFYIKLYVVQNMEAAERAKLEDEIRTKQEEVSRIQEEVAIKDTETRRLQEEVEDARRKQVRYLIL